MCTCVPNHIMDGHILVNTHLDQRVLAALVDKLERVDAVPCGDATAGVKLVLRFITLTCDEPKAADSSDNVPSR